MLTLFTLVIVFVIILCIWYIFGSKSFLVCEASHIPFEDRNYIEYKDLLDVKIRSNPHKFNKHIYENIIKKSDDKCINNGIIPVDGEKRTFLICKYNQIKEILTNESIFSSNPFPDERLIAPNAMNHEKHKKIMKYLKKYYSQSAISKQIPIIEKIIENVMKNFIHREKINKQINKQIGCDIMNGFCKIIVMKIALFMIGLPSKKYNNFKIVNKMIKLNDKMVKLVAPQGGIGYKIEFSFIQLINVFFGLIFSLIPTIQLIFKIGIINTWNILRPDLNILKLPNKIKDNGTPRLQIWIYPNILYAVPQYFLYLNDLYENYGKNLKFPNPIKETNIINGKNVLQSLYDAECNKDMTRSEILVTIVQLMVNMTTANEIGNMFYRLSSLSSLSSISSLSSQYDENVANRLIQEVLRYDASLQRLPRRCRVDIDNFYQQKFPKNSNLILMIGLANCDKDIFGDKSFEFIPDRYLDKNLNKPLTFGYGIHLCLGYLLVKREMNLTLKCLIKHGIKNINYKSSQRMVDIDVGNYGFNRLFVEFEY